MSQVIILTSNLYSEQTLEQDLKFLGHEVFCTSKMILNPQSLSLNKQLFNHFDFVFLSETLSEDHADHIVQMLNLFSIVSIRKISQIPTKQKEAEWKAQGITQWLMNTAAIEELREKMTAASGIHKIKESSPYNTDILAEEQVLFRFRWTKTEQKILDVLLKNKGAAITRDRLCEEIWESGNTNSRLSQLSYTVSHLKRKLRNSGITEEMIKTVWGEGYQINPHFAELLSQLKK